MFFGMFVFFVKSRNETAVLEFGDFLAVLEFGDVWGSLFFQSPEMYQPRVSSIFEDVCFSGTLRGARGTG